MPLLPTPPNSPLVGGDLPVTGTADLEAEEADFVSDVDVAQVRDAIRSAETELALEYQRLSTRAAGQTDPRRAQGMFLAGLGRDRQVFQQPLETQEPYRDRVLHPPTPVTPDAICDTANAILAKYTTKICRYYESILDRMFLGDSTSTCRFASCLSAGSSRYPDRLYHDDSAINGGDFIPNRDPLGCRLHDDMFGRFFVLLVPLVGFVDTGLGFVFATEVGVLDGFFLSDSINSAGVASFVNEGPAQRDIYQQIANAIDRLVGQGQRWQLMTDPNL